MSSQSQTDCFSKLVMLTNQESKVTPKGIWIFLGSISVIAWYISFIDPWKSMKGSAFATYDLNQALTALVFANTKVVRPLLDLFFLVSITNAKILRL